MPGTWALTVTALVALTIVGGIWHWAPQFSFSKRPIVGAHLEGDVLVIPGHRPPIALNAILYSMLTYVGVSAWGELDEGVLMDAGLVAFIALLGQMSLMSWIELTHPLDLRLDAEKLVLRRVATTLEIPWDDLSLAYVDFHGEIEIRLWGKLQRHHVAARRLPGVRILRNIRATGGSFLRPEVVAHLVSVLATLDVDLRRRILTGGAVQALQVPIHEHKDRIRIADEALRMNEIRSEVAQKRERQRQEIIQVVEARWAEEQPKE